MLKRPEAFACWLEKTAEKPIEFEINIDVEVNDSMTESLLQKWLSSESDKQASLDIPVYAHLPKSSSETSFSFFPKVFAQEEVNADLVLGSFIRMEPSSIILPDDEIDYYLQI